MNQLSKKCEHDLAEKNKKEKQELIKKVVQELVSKDPKIRKNLENLMKAFIDDNPKLFQ